MSDVLRVEVNALAVRRTPDVLSPLATGYRLSDGTSIGEVRLNEGDFVSVDLGPLQIGETTWYRVWPAQGGQLHYSTIQWDTQDNGANPVEPGWVAASVGADEYLSLHEAFEPDPQSAGSGVSLLVSGMGDYLSEPQDGFDLLMIYWAHQIDEQDGPCDFTVTLITVGAAAGPAEVDRSLIGSFEEGQVQVQRESFEPYQVAVSSGCEWSVHVEPLHHD